MFRIISDVQAPKVTRRHLTHRVECWSILEFHRQEPMISEKSFIIQFKESTVI
jgi:hypothetical protein